MITETTLNAWFDECERSAFERSVAAKIDDDRTRLICTLEVKTIRTLRGKLKALEGGEANPVAKGPRP